MKKTWIKVKRGILEQKHIDKLGQAWYLYFYILDQADWESGKITGWKDEYAADDLGKPIGLIRDHRKKLANEKYIRYEKGQHDQTIIINNWTDPRRYDFHVINPDNESMEESEVSNGESLPQTSGQTSGQTILDPSQNNVPSYNHISHNHIPKEEYSLNREQYNSFENDNKLLLDNIFLGITGYYPTADKSQDTRRSITVFCEKKGIEINSKKFEEIKSLLRPYFLEWCKRKAINGNPYSRTNITWLTEWAVLGEIPPEKQKNKTVADLTAGEPEIDYKLLRKQIEDEKKARLNDSR